MGQAPWLPEFEELEEPEEPQHHPTNEKKISGTLSGQSGLLLNHHYKKGESVQQKSIVQKFCKRPSRTTIEELCF